MSASVPIDLPKVTIIILNWNGFRDTIECLHSVQKINYPNYQVLVVDNGSTDDSVAQIRQTFPAVPLLETGENLGYAGGNNAGIAYALNQHPTFILLLNNDTVVDPDILTAFVDAASRYPRAGIFGAQMCYYAQPDTIWALGGGNWDASSAGFPHFANNQRAQDLTNSEIFAIDYVIGCALFCRADMIRDIGVMEEAFFLNFEEMDWCYRARAAGYLSYAVPDARLWHKVSVSFGGEESPLRQYFMARNELLWARRHLTLRERVRVTKKVLLRLFPGFSVGEPGKHGFAQRLYWETIRYLLEINRRRHQPYYQAQLYGVLDYLRGRFGDCPPSIRKELIKKRDDDAR